MAEDEHIAIRTRLLQKRSASMAIDYGEHSAHVLRDNHTHCHPGKIYTTLRSGQHPMLQQKLEVCLGFAARSTTRWPEIGSRLKLQL